MARFVQRNPCFPRERKRLGHLCGKTPCTNFPRTHHPGTSSPATCLKPFQTDIRSHICCWSDLRTSLALGHTWPRRLLEKDPPNRFAWFFRCCNSQHILASFLSACKCLYRRLERTPLSLCVSKCKGLVPDISTCRPPKIAGQCICLRTPLPSYQRRYYFGCRRNATLRTRYRREAVLVQTRIFHLFYANKKQRTCQIYRMLQCGTFAHIDTAFPLLPGAVLTRNNYRRILHTF